MHWTVHISGWMHHTSASTCVTSVSSQAATLCHPSHWDAAATTEIWLPSAHTPLSRHKSSNPKSHKVSASHKISSVEAEASQSKCCGVLGACTPWETPELLSPPIWGVHQTKWGHITPFRGCTASTQSQPIWGQHKSETRL